MVSQEKLQEMQFLEQNLQSLMMQKQAFQMELSETKAALKELDNSGDDVFKLVGQLMLKTDKKKMKEELITKEKLLEKRSSLFRPSGKLRLKLSSHNKSSNLICIVILAESLVFFSLLCKSKV